MWWCMQSSCMLSSTFSDIVARASGGACPGCLLANCGIGRSVGAVRRLEAAEVRSVSFSACDGPKAAGKEGAGGQVALSLQLGMMRRPRRAACALEGALCSAGSGGGFWCHVSTPVDFFLIQMGSHDCGPKPVLLRSCSLSVGVSLGGRKIRGCCTSVLTHAGATSQPDQHIPRRNILYEL